MKRPFSFFEKPNIWLAAILIVAFTFPIADQHADAASSNYGFVIHSDSIDGQGMMLGVDAAKTSKGTQPMLQFHYTHVTIKGLTLTKVIHSSNGPITVKITAPKATADNMKVDATGFAAGGACLKLGKSYPNLVLKDVTLGAHKQKADNFNLEGAKITVTQGDHGVKYPGLPKTLKDLAGLPFKELQKSVHDLMSGHVPLLCNKDDDQDKNKNNDHCKNPTDKSGKEAKKATDEAGKAAKKTTDKAGKTAKEVTNKAKKTVEDTTKDAGSTIHRVTDDAGDVANGAGKTGKKITDDAGDTVGDVTKDAGDTVKHVTGGHPEKTPNDVKHTVHHAVKHTNQIVDDLLGEVGQLGNQVSGILSDVTNEQHTLGSLTSSINYLQDEIDKDLDHITFGLFHISETKKHLKDLKQNQLKDLKKEKSKLQSFQKVVNQKQRKVSSLKSKLKQLKNRNHPSSGKLNKEISQVNDKISKTSNKLDQLQKDINKNKKNIKDQAKDTKKSLHKKQRGHIVTNLLKGILKPVNTLLKNLI